MDNSPLPESAPNRLVLADGSRFVGRPFGAPKPVRGEVVFHTGLVGYVEALTDPSYRGQILALTYPLQGNYGVPSPLDWAAQDPPAAPRFESDRIQVAGLIVAQYTPTPSHHAATQSLGAWLASQGVPALSGIDTRALTQRLRQHGTLAGALLPPGVDDVTGFAQAPQAAMADVAHAVQPRQVRIYEGGGPRILVIDTGCKESIVASLRQRGAAVVRAPADSAWEPYVDHCDGVLLGNGPGDPKDLPALCDRVRSLFSARGGSLPLFGICLGHQLLARAAGADTYKLPFGHRSHNQPVIDLLSRRAYVTSQNHGYAVDTATLPADFAPWFENLNDGTNEGLRHRYRPLLSVQFHPEAAAGPRDTAFLFDEFLRMVTAIKSSRTAPISSTVQP